MRPDIWLRLEETYRKFPFACVGQVAEPEVGLLEKELDSKLPADYREFVSRFGGATVGPFPVYGLRRAEAMGEGPASAADLTRDYRSQGWSGTDEWVVFSQDHAGNPIGFDKDGRVWLSDHDTRSIRKLAEDFEGFVLYCLRLSHGK